VKYEEVYIIKDAMRGLSRSFRLYNHERLHESLGYRAPVYYGCEGRIMNIALKLDIWEALRVIHQIPL